MSWCDKEGTGSGMVMPDIPMVPLPMVIFAFLFGVMFGVILGRKRQMMMQQGGWQGGMQGGMHGMHGTHGGRPWMKQGMPPHHHHGTGAPACCESHTEWPEPVTGENPAVADPGA